MKNFNFLRSWFAAAALCAALSSYAVETKSTGIPARVWLTDAKGLGNEVRNHAGVLDRYERHFGMDESSVLSFMDSLHAGSLAQTGTFVVYEADADGVENARTQTLKKGEPVFLDTSNKPVLLADGGVPIKAVEAAAPISMASTAAAAATNAPLLASEPTTTTEVALKPVEEPALAPVAPISTVATATSPAAQSGAATPAARKSFGWAWATLVPPALIFLSTTGHGGNGGGAQPVPEPASMAVLALGGLGLMRRKRA